MYEYEWGVGVEVEGTEVEVEVEVVRAVEPPEHQTRNVIPKEKLRCTLMAKGQCTIYVCLVVWRDRLITGTGCGLAGLWSFCASGNFSQ